MHMSEFQHISFKNMVDKHDIQINEIAVAIEEKIWQEQTLN